MKKGFFIGLVATVSLPRLLLAVPRDIPMEHVMQNAAISTERSQISRDMEGLDPHEGGISKSVRGSFTVKHYISGPWRGGRAVIEVANDLYYAEVRIYDKDDVLQRIYSIQSKATKTGNEDEKFKTPAKVLEQIKSESANMNPPAASKAAPAAEQQAAANPASAEATAESSAAATPKKHHRRIKRRVVKGGLDTTLSGEPKVVEEYVEVDEPEPTPRKRASAASAAVSAPAPVPVVAAVPATADTSESAASAASSKTSKGKHPYRYSETAEATPPAAAPPAVDAAAVDPTKVPSTEELLNGDTGTSASGSNRTASVTGHGSAGAATAGSSGRESKAAPGIAVAQLPASITNSPIFKPSGAASASVPPIVKPTSLPPANPGTQSASIPSGEPAAISAPIAKSAEQADVRKQLEANPKAAIESMKQTQAASAPMESDSWNPKTMAVPAAVDITPEIPGPGKSAGKKHQEEELVPARVRGGGGMDSDAWSPTRKSAKLDAREEQTLAMVSKIGTMNPAKPKVSKDINNPEEGVNPFMSLEKFSGPQYGRHREFERRAVYKKNPKSQIQGYDFYIDEVDRKEERHYLYYYKVDPQTKSAKLIGIEKHDRVTFLSDYDIKSDGKAKIVRY